MNYSTGKVRVKFLNNSDLTSKINSNFHAHSSSLDFSTEAVNKAANCDVPTRNPTQEQQHVCLTALKKKVKN